MAILHQADVRPTKLELLAGWLPSQSWWSGEVAEISPVGAFRFDDPAGVVGVETLLVRTATSPVWQVPLTYRGAPLLGAEDALIGSMEHTVLGHRWVYDGCADPVYVATLLETIRTGGHEAELFVEVDGLLERRDPSCRVRGSGTGADSVSLVEIRRTRNEGVVTVIELADVQLTVHRAVAPVLPGTPQNEALTLTGAWADGPGDVLLVTARPSALA